MKEKKENSEGLDVAKQAVDIATDMLNACKTEELPPEIAYAAFANAFTRLHIGLGKGKKEWEEISKIMGSLIDLTLD